MASTRLANNTKRGFLVVAVACLPFCGVASAQIVQPIPKTLINSPSKNVEVFSLGYGAGVANYMCFESLKQNLSQSAGNQILSNYKKWIAQQKTVKMSYFKQGFNLEVLQFNQAFPSNPCRFKL